MALPRLSAYVLTAVTAAQLVAAAVLLTLAPDPVGTAIVVGFGVLALVAAAPGMLVAVRRPGNAVGPLLVLVAAVVTWLELHDRYGWAVTRRPGLLPASDLYLGLTGRWIFLYVPAALLMPYFPDGRLPGPRCPDVIERLDQFQPAAERALGTVRGVDAYRPSARHEVDLNPRGSVTSLERHVSSVAPPTVTGIVVPTEDFSVDHAWGCAEC